MREKQSWRKNLRSSAAQNLGGGPFSPVSTVWAWIGGLHHDMQSSSRCSAKRHPHGTSFPVQIHRRVTGTVHNNTSQPDSPPYLSNYHSREYYYIIIYILLFNKHSRLHAICHKAGRWQCNPPIQ